MGRPALVHVLRIASVASLVATPLLVACSDDGATLTGSRSNGQTSSSSGDDGSSGSSGSSGSGGSSGSSGDDGSSGSPTPSGDGSAAQLCADTINAYRKTLGLTPLARWTEIESCSDGQAKSDGQTRAAHGAFGKCGEQGQNECPGWPGAPSEMIPKCLKAMWGEGPGGGHYEAMASKQYTKVACGFADGQGGTWAVQNFR